jgi:hypothetical protein
MKSDKNSRSGQTLLLHLFALMNANKVTGPGNFRRKKMKYRRLSYAIAGLGIYMAWTLFFIISELNASIFMSLFHKIAKRIAFGY